MMRHSLSLSLSFSDSYLFWIWGTAGVASMLPIIVGDERGFKTFLFLFLVYFGFSRLGVSGIRPWKGIGLT